MAYATGSAADVDALMEAVMAFATGSPGMVEAINRTESIDGNTYEVRCLSKGTSFWWFRWRASEVIGMPATDDAGSTWATVVGRPANDSLLYPIIAPFLSYHLFYDSGVLWVAVEQSSGAWQHFCFGDVTKYGSWTGGHFLGMTYYHFQVDSPSFPGIGPGLDISNASGMCTAAGLTAVEGAFPIGPSGRGCSYLYAPYSSKNFASPQVGEGDMTYNKMWIFGLSMDQAGGLGYLQRNRLNNFNGRTSGMRAEVLMCDPVSGLFLPMGYVPNVRLIDVTNFNGGDLINTDRMVFPMGKKGDGGIFSQYMATGTLGWAIKKV